MDHRSDLFSLGCVMYAMCVGRSPFRAETPTGAIHRVCEDTPRPIRAVNPDIPEWLVAIIDRLLEKDREQRFQSATDVAATFSQYLAHYQQPSLTFQPSPKMPLPKAGKGRSSTPRHGFLLAARIALFLLCGLALTEATGITSVTQFPIRHIHTPYGTVVVQTMEDGIKVDVTENEETITVSGLGEHTLELRPGRHPYRALKDGETMQTGYLVVKRGEKQVLMIGASSTDNGTHIASRSSLSGAAGAAGTLIVSRFSLSGAGAAFPYPVTIKGPDFEKTLDTGGLSRLDLRPGTYDVEMVHGKTGQVLQSGTVRIVSGITRRIHFHGGGSFSRPVCPQPNPLAKLLGHTKPVPIVVFSPDLGERGHPRKKGWVTEAEAVVT